MRSKKGASKNLEKKGLITTSKYWTSTQQGPLLGVFFGESFLGRQFTTPLLMGTWMFRVLQDWTKEVMVRSSQTKPFFLFVGWQPEIQRFHAPVWGRLVVEIPLFTTGFCLHPKGGCLGFLKHQPYHCLKGLHQNLSTVLYLNLESQWGGRIWPRRALHVASLETEASTGGKGFNKREDVHLMWFFRVIFVKISDLEAWRILWITRMICVDYRL